MIQKLDEAGLVDYEQYNGVAVTERGETVALGLIRKHRLLETFLAELLGIPWPDVHEEADRLEHHISDEFADRLADLLGNPRTDPHGDVIPDAGLRLPDDPPETGLPDSDPGERLVVDQVPHHQSAVREYLFEYDIDPGTTIEIDEIAPVGIVTITNHETGRTVSIPNRIARQIRVRSGLSTTEQANY